MVDNWSKVKALLFLSYQRKCRKWVNLGRFFPRNTPHILIENFQIESNENKSAFFFRFSRIYWYPCNQAHAARSLSYVYRCKSDKDFDILFCSINEMLAMGGQQRRDTGNLKLSMRSKEINLIQLVIILLPLLILYHMMECSKWCVVYPSYPLSLPFPFPFDLCASDLRLLLCG